ncbi:MAG: rhomboid family intramembrane serine protease, partial [Candidatus Nezhaarchaeales archaeon]
MIPLPSETRGARRPIVAWILIIANFVIFLYFYVQGPQVFNEAIRGLGMIPSHILKGERLYTLVTSMFMHGDWMHIIGNMLYLYVF